MTEEDKQRLVVLRQMREAIEQRKQSFVQYNETVVRQLQMMEDNNTTILKLLEVNKVLAESNIVTIDELSKQYDDNMSSEEIKLIYDCNRLEKQEDEERIEDYKKQHSSNLNEYMRVQKRMMAAQERARYKQIIVNHGNSRQSGGLT